METFRRFPCGVSRRMFYRLLGSEVYALPFAAAYCERCRKRYHACAELRDAKRRAAFNHCVSAFSCFFASSFLVFAGAFKAMDNKAKPQGSARHFAEYKAAMRIGRFERAA